MSTAEPVSSTTTVRGLAASTASIRRSWSPGSWRRHPVPAFGLGVGDDDDGNLGVAGRLGGVGDVGPAVVVDPVARGGLAGRRGR